MNPEPETNASLGSWLAKIIKYLVAIAFVAEGAVLAWRVIHGAFRLLAVPVNLPLNAQGVVGVSATILLLLHSWRGRHPADTNLRGPLLWLIGILVVTSILLWPALGYPLVSDDYLLARYGEGLNRAMAKYYFTTAGGDGFFRPVGMVSLGFGAKWAAHDPFRWHLLGLALHLANVVFLWLLASRLLRSGAGALWAAAVFALHGAVLLTATFLAARFDVLSVFFILAGLVLFLRYLDERDRLALVASLVCAFLGFLTKEVAYSLPLLILIVGGRAARQHWRAAGAYFLLAGVMFVYRFWLLGGIGGYHNSTGQPDILQPHFLRYLKGFGLRIWSLFYFPINWSHEPEPWLKILLLAYLAALAGIALTARGSRRGLLQTLVFTGVALLPVAHLLLIDAGISGAPRVYLASVGFAMFVAAAIQGVDKRVRSIVAGTVVVFQIAALWHNLLIWGQTAELADRICANAARNGAERMTADLPSQIDGVPFMRNGFEACVAFHRAQMGNGSPSR